MVARCLVVDERHQRHLARFDRHEFAPGTAVGDHVADAAEKAIAAAGGHQHLDLGLARDAMHDLGPALHFHQRRSRRAVAARARQARRIDAVGASGRVEKNHRIDGAASQQRSQAVALLERQRSRIDAVALARAHPAVFREDHRQRFVQHRRLQHRFFRFLDHRAALVAERLDVGLDFLDHQRFQRLAAAEHFLQPLLLLRQAFEFLFQFDVLEPGQLAQAHLEDVLGLPVGELERAHQVGLGIVRIADQLDHLVHVEQHQQPPFEHVDAVEHLVQAESGAPRHRGETEFQPLGEDVLQVLAGGPPVQSDHHQVDRGVGLHAGFRQHEIDELVLVLARGLGLEHQAHRVAAVGFVARAIEHRQHQLLFALLLRGERFLPRPCLRIGDGLDLLKDFARRGARRQLVHHHLPLPARKALYGPARAHPHRAAAVGIGLAHLGARRDDLAAAGEVRALDVFHHPGEREFGFADERDRGVGDFGQVVAGNLGGHAHGDARGAVQQHHRQARRQQLRLDHAAVVVGREIHGAAVEFRQQHLGEFGQARLGVAHRRRLVAVARAEVALAVHQRVAQAEVLRDAHHRVIHGGVAVRMELAEHVADHARGFLARRAGAPVHFPHGVEDARLHRLLPVGHARQRAVLDRAHRVLQILQRRVFGERQRVAEFARERRKVGRLLATAATAALRGRRRGALVVVVFAVLALTFVLAVANRRRGAAARCTRRLQGIFRRGHGQAFKQIVLISHPSHSC